MINILKLNIIYKYYFNLYSKTFTFNVKHIYSVFITLRNILYKFYSLILRNLALATV